MSRRPGYCKAGSPVGTIVNAILAFKAKTITEGEVRFPPPVILAKECTVEHQYSGEWIVHLGDLVLIGRTRQIVRQGLEDVVSVRSRSRIIGVTIGTQPRAKAQGMTPGILRRIILQFEDVLVILYYSCITSAVGEHTLNRDGRAKIAGNLVVAHSAPLKVSFIDQMWINDHSVAELNGIFLIVYVISLLGKIQCAYSARSLD